MAEVLATMVVGPLVSMVKEKASSYLLDQYKVMEGMEEQHTLLKRKLPAVLDVITDAEEQAAKNRQGAKVWLEDLRMVAYKANDVLDEFKYEALRRKAKAEGHYKEFGMDVIKLFPSHNRFVFRYRMANKLRMILQKIDILIAEMNIFRFKFKPPPPMSLKWRQTDPYMPSNIMNIASKSRANDKEKIVNALLNQSNNVNLTVLTVVGMGGIGKTTLAQLVYNDNVIQNHFQVRLWQCMSENFDVDSLVQRIVEEINKANDPDKNGNSAPNKPKSAMCRVRYLLILDDVWNREANKWEKLKFSLPHSGTGNSVLITTRDDHVAQFMGTIEAHEIKHLKVGFVEEIIKTRAFSSPEKGPAELQKMVPDVAKRCSGSPLAATALGSVLCTKNTVQEWKAVLNRSTICDEENGILPILKLSYNCLPPHMRQCFAFCAMFPKDHEIDVEMLIQLWMANCFIPEQKGVCLEVTGQQVFNELAQRSFFQEVKKDITDKRVRITCKIHDLMHDVAQDSMGKECAALDTKLSQSEDFPYTARHLFLSADISENVLNASLEKGSLGFQTLICDKSRKVYVQLLSKYCRSVRALKTQQCSLLEPKFLHHLRYLDLSGSDVETLPECITIMYHLQTLNLSDCRGLKQLPMAMKYMTALRHLYTHGCWNLTSMPPNLRHLTSLQTLTCFVPSTDPSCSKLGELEKLDLGGHLELIRLEIVTGADAKAATLWEKKRMEELTLEWSERRHDKETDKEVLEGLRPHDGLKAMRMSKCRTNSIPTWMLELKGMVELELKYCQNLEKLPALWQLPALQILSLDSLRNLQCLFSGGAPSKFQKLKRMDLQYMPKFKKWWDTTVVQEQEPLFPEVEYLRIWECESLTELPKASVVRQCSGKDDTKCRSAFPALRELHFSGLKKCHRWEAVEGTLGEQVTFPQLEILYIRASSGLTGFPEAPKLHTLELMGYSEGETLQAASKYIHSVTSMSLVIIDVSTFNMQANSIEVVRGHEPPCPLRDLELNRCGFLFFQPSAAMLWKSFGQLSKLKIYRCHGLVYWPENLFHGLVSLRTLEIVWCSDLKGITVESSGEQSAPGWSGRPLPCLESLVIRDCGSMVQVPNQLLSAASLKTLRIEECHSLESMVFGEQQEDTRRLQVCEEGGAVKVQPEETPSSLTLTSLETFGISLLICESLKSMVFSEQQQEDTSSSLTLIAVLLLSTAVLKMLSSSSASSCFFPSLESLVIKECRGLTKVANLPPSIKTLKIKKCGLTKVANLPPSIKTLKIKKCGNLVSVSGEVRSLENLNIYECESLQSLPSEPHQVYSSLRVLSIEKSPLITQLGPSLRLQQRENHFDENAPDIHIQEQVEIDSNPESMSDEASAVVLTQSSSTSSDHSVFPCLESLKIHLCDGLKEVPNLPPTIKTLDIFWCPRLVTLSGEVRSLEELEINNCKNLQSLSNGPHQVYSSLRVLSIGNCPGIKQFAPSLRLQQHDNHFEEKGPDSHLQEQVELDSKPESMSDEASTTVVLTQSSSTSSDNSGVFPCLESIIVYACNGLTEVPNLPPSIKTLGISRCDGLVSLSGDVPSLEQLELSYCKRLKSLPNGPAYQAYSSLRLLRIKQCGGIKQLPRSLQQRLDHLEKKDLDTHLLQGRTAALMSKLKCFRPSQD